MAQGLVLFFTRPACQHRPRAVEGRNFGRGVDGWSRAGDDAQNDAQMRLGSRELAVDMVLIIEYVRFQVQKAKKASKAERP